MANRFNADQIDSSLNTFREVFSDPTKSGDPEGFNGNVIIPLDFSLEMDGISGLIPHSAFTIPVETLPDSYIVQSGDEAGKSKIAFILHSIDQNFNNNKWTTKIAGQTLNIRFEPLTAAEKKAIKDAQDKQKLNNLSKYKNAGNKPPKNTPDPPVKVTKSMTSFEAIVKAVIVNLEGGYYNGGGNKDSRYNTSGETMFGIDRKNKGKCPSCSRFWKVMDDNNARQNWPYLYIPKDPIKTELFNLTAQIQKTDYEKWRNRYLDKEVTALVEGDGRLFYHMVYASWNGEGWFRGFSKLLNNAYKHGSKTSDNLLDLITKERISGGKIAYTLGTGKPLGAGSASLISQTGYKIAKATDVKI